jgi:hypothetical protein
MSSSERYRTRAEDCLRMASSPEHHRDKPFWLNLAQSWLRLAEQPAQADHSEKSASETRRQS